MTQWSEEVIRQVSFPPIKGQLISKRFFGVVDFLQKTNENKSIWGIIVVKLNSFVRFLEEIDDPQKTLTVVEVSVQKVKKDSSLPGIWTHSTIKHYFQD